MRASDFGLPYAHEVIAAVEASSCSMGCTLALGGSKESPGGSCSYLVAASLDDDVPFRAKGREILCLRRRPIPRKVLAKPAPQEGLF